MGIISRRVLLFVQLGQGTAGDTGIANAQHAARNQMPQPCTAHPQQFPQATLRPSVFDPSARTQSTKTEAHSADRAPEAFGNFRDWFVAGKIQKFVVI